MNSQLFLQKMIHESHYELLFLYSTFSFIYHLDLSQVHSAMSFMIPHAPLETVVNIAQYLNIGSNNRTPFVRRILPVIRVKLL